MKKTNTQVLGLFPLGLIVLPGEETRLHIYEPKYKQLINDCFAKDKDFGIPFFSDSTIKPFGTKVKLVDIEKFYQDGKMDIKVIGDSIFKINQMTELDKLYQGAHVNEYFLQDQFEKKAELIDLYHEFCLNTLNDDPAKGFNPNIGLYHIAKSLNLTNHQKLKLISTQDQIMQQNILINHLRYMLKLLEQEELLQNKFFLN